MSAGLAVLLSGLAAAALALLVPTIVRRLPEPPADDLPDDPVEDTELEADLRSEGPKELYATIAALPWLRPFAVVASASLAAGLAWHLGADRALVGWVPLVPLGVALAVIDARTRLLPYRLVQPATLALVVLGAVSALAERDVDQLVRALIGSAIGWLLFGLLHVLYLAGMGRGDVRLAATLGFALAWLGWAELVVGLYAGFLVMGLYALVRMLAERSRAALKAKVPFGPFMLAGAWVGAVAAGPVVRALGY